MLLLRDEAHWKRAWAYKDHGKNPDKFFAPAPASGFRYLHDSFGSNWRMTEMQAAIGRASSRKRMRELRAGARAASSRPSPTTDRKSTRLNSSHSCASRMPSSA